MRRINRLSPIIHCAALLVSFMFIAQQAQSQRTFDTSVSVSEFALAHARWEAANHRRALAKILVPMLEIYSPTGALIYHGTQSDTGHAVGVLASLPATPSPSPPPDTQMGLSDILDISPDLARWKNTILSRHHFVVVSISVQGKWKISNAYSEQNHAVDSIPKRPGVDIDVVHINLIFPGN